jgi:hypothetical protein
VRRRQPANAQSAYYSGDKIDSPARNAQRTRLLKVFHRFDAIYGYDRKFKNYRRLPCKAVAMPKFPFSTEKKLSLVSEPAANVLLYRVVDGAMACELAAQPLIDERFISRRID